MEWLLSPLHRDKGHGTAAVSAFYKLDLHFPHGHQMDDSMVFHYPKGLSDCQMDHSMVFHYPKGLSDCQMDDSMVLVFHYPKGLSDCQMDDSMVFHYPKGLSDCQMDDSMVFHYPKGLSDCQMDDSMVFHYPKGLSDCQMDDSMVLVFHYPMCLVLAVAPISVAHMCAYMYIQVSCMCCVMVSMCFHTGIVPVRTIFENHNFDKSSSIHNMQSCSTSELCKSFISL